MRKFMLATGCAMALACALAVAPPSGAAEANRPVSPPTLTMLGRPIQDTPSSCEPYTIRSASFFKADGSPSTSADLTAGFVLMERTPAGLDVSLAVPPEGFTPATATDSTLSLFGIPDRPKSNEALADWLTVWGRTLHLPSIALPLGCSLPVASDLSVNSTEPAAGDPSSVASSTNCSGRLAGGTYFTSVAGTVTQPLHERRRDGDATGIHTLQLWRCKQDGAFDVGRPRRLEQRFFGPERYRHIEGYSPTVLKNSSPRTAVMVVENVSNGLR